MDIGDERRIIPHSPTVALTFPSATGTERGRWGGIKYKRLWSVYLGKMQSVIQNYYLFLRECKPSPFIKEIYSLDGRSVSFNWLRLRNTKELPRYRLPSKGGRSWFLKPYQSGKIADQSSRALGPRAPSKARRAYSSKERFGGPLRLLQKTPQKAVWSS